jgi:hypothetical protein
MPVRWAALVTALILRCAREYQITLGFATD